MAEKKTAWDAVKDLGGLVFEGLATGKVPDRVVEEVHSLLVANKVAAPCPTCGAPLREVKSADGTAVQFCAPCSGLQEK